MIGHAPQQTAATEGDGTGNEPCRMNKFLSFRCSQIADAYIGRDGILTAKITGSSPSWLVAALPFHNKYLTVTMKFRPDNPERGKYYYSKLYFQAVGMTGFDETHSLTLPIRTFDTYHTYVFKCIPFQQTSIIKLRFDPVNHPGTISLSNFELLDYGGHLAPAAKVDFVFLNYDSRSGSTAAMKVLTRHPRIAGYREGTHDAHILNYFLKFYNLIKTSHLDSTDSGQGIFLNRLKALLDWHDPEIVLPKPIEFARYVHLDCLKEYYGRFIRDYVPHVLSEMGTDNIETAKYYIEKNLDHTAATAGALLDLRPESKVLSIFRDPRDVFLSAISFRKKERILDPTSTAPEGQIRSIIEHYRTRLEWLRKIGDAGFIFRYEDLMKNSEKTIQSILEFLQVDTSEAILNDLVGVLHGNDLQAERHITAESADASIGRWKQDLSPEHAGHFEKYADIFHELGYAI